MSIVVKSKTKRFTAHKLFLIVGLIILILTLLATWLIQPFVADDLIKAEHKHIFRFPTSFSLHLKKLIVGQKGVVWVSTVTSIIILLFPQTEKPVACLRARSN